jgi:fatty acid desaturase
MRPGSPAAGLGDVMSAVERFKKFFMERVLVFVILMGFWLLSSLVLWLRTTFWLAFAWFVGQFVLLLIGIAFSELRDGGRARRARTD